MFEKAYGKINLSLNIKGVREDGYHTLESIFLPINFYDELYITKSDEMLFECNRKYIRFNEQNTIVKAIDLMKKEFNINDNFKVVLNKQIPMQAGLAGGSSDGAATIRILNKMYHLDLNEEKIKELCLKIGADVYFTYHHKPAFVSGIGDEIRFIDIKDDYYVLIVKPRKGVSTKECYKLMNMDSCYHPDISKLEEALINGNDIIQFLGNSMEEAAISLLKDIEDIKKLLIENGAPFALMSGSGSSVFTISKDINLIKTIYESIKEKGYFIRYTKIVH